MKLLWVGDAACSSGFGRASTHILDGLRKVWDIVVLGVNYRGDPHPYPYPIYPAWTNGDQLGLGRLKEMCQKVKPDLIVFQTNPWNVPVYQQRLFKEGLGDIPLTAIVAVEGKNCRGTQLNGMRKVIFWTEFAQREAVKGGLTVPSEVIPLGVDVDFFTPGDRQEARDVIDLPDVPKDAFIVGNVNRNQTRKRLDLSVIYFAKWIKQYDIRDAYLYLHALPGSSARVNLEQLAQYFGVEHRLILAEPLDVWLGAPETFVRASYRAANVGLNTGLGEGWGLTAMESMACMTPVIAGDVAALGEWGRGAIYLTACYPEGVMPDVNNMLGAQPTEDGIIGALQTMYSDPLAYTVFQRSGYERVHEPQYRWENIAHRFVEAFEGLV